MEILKKFELDFARKVNDVTVYAKQYDSKSRYLEITPINKGKLFELESGTTARLQLTKADGKSVMIDAEIKNGIIVAELTMQALSASGKARAEIALYKNGAVLSSQTFCINVEKAAYDETAIKSSSEYESLISTLARAETVTKDATEITQKVKDTQKEADGILQSLKEIEAPVSPTVEIVDEADGHKVVITDKNGSRQFTVLNGKNGAKGEAGATPQLSIGTVQTLASTSNATATLSGTAEAPVLNLGIPKGADGTDSQAMPEYVLNEVETKLEKIIENQRKNNMTFLAMSDFHELIGNQNIETGNIHAGMAAAAISNAIRLDFAAILGDLTSDFKAIEITKVNRYINDACAGIPNFRTPGEHDYMTHNYGEDGENLNEYQVYNLFGKYNDGAIFDDENKVGGYCYRDFDEYKTRIICLNTAEIKGLAINSSDYIERITAQQLQWFAKTLDMSAKSDADQWGIIILSHHPLDWASIMPASKVLASYVSGGILSLTHEGTQVSYDFTNKNKAEIICQFHGHLHNFKVDYIRSDESGTLTTVKRISIPNACFMRNNIYSKDSVFGETRTRNKSAGRAADTTFEVISIDRDARQIHCINYGAGDDRVVDY